MAYSYTTQAEDVLSASTVKMTLPASALALDAVREVLGVSKKTALAKLDSLARRGGDGTRLAVVELSSVDWEWDVETVDVYDEEGRQQSLEVRKGYGIDKDAVGALSNIQSRASQALGCLGIPHDCEVFDGVAGVDGCSGVQRRRLASEPGRVGDYCESQPMPDALDPQEAMDMAQACSNLGDYCEWLRMHIDDCPDLGADSLRFDALLSEPGRSAFIEASARLLGLGGGSAPWRRWGAEPDPIWRPELSDWIREEWRGENPLARFARCGLPIALPRLEKFMEMARAEPSPDEAFAAASLSAYCVAYGSSAVAGPDRRVPVRAAAAVGKCLGAMPSLAGMLEPGAKSFFDSELEAAGSNASDAERAGAEAHWLRAQSIMSAGGASRSVRRPSL